MILVFIVIFAIVLIGVITYLMDRSEDDGYRTKRNNIKSQIKGKVGEAELKNNINNLTFFDRGYTLKNLYIPTYNGNTTEIDLVLVHKSGIYVFENKNYSGNIYGYGNNKYWTQYLGGSKNSFYNPILQNKGHIKNLARTLKLKESEFINVVVFGDSANVKVSDYDNNVIITKTSKVRQIKPLLKNVVNFTDDEVREIAEKLKEYTNVDKATKERHIKNCSNFKKYPK